MIIPNSINAFQQAKDLIPGGVNSPVRAYKSVQADPVFVREAHGSVITDIDGNSYVDFVSSWGPMILGHAHPAIVEAVCNATAKGTSFGAPTEAETMLAQKIVDMVPSIEMVRMVNSGTEATMSAVRLARGYTGRRYIVKFAGCYHGHADGFLIRAGSGAMTFSLPGSPGVTENVAAETLIAEYNDIESVKLLFEKHGDQIAAVIVEPVAGNMGVVIPEPGFLQELRVLTQSSGTLLIFDEVITGFRLAPGGAQEYYGVMPDITVLGKIIGGGLPVGAYGGSQEIMSLLAPEGPVYQAGTLSGNPLAMAAGMAMLNELSKPGFYADLETKAKQVEDALRTEIQRLSYPAVLNRVGSMMTLFFNAGGKVTNSNEAEQSDRDTYARYFKSSLKRGLWIAPSQFECLFISAAHTSADLEKLLEAAKSFLEDE